MCSLTAESTVGSNKPVSPKFTSLLQRADPLCRWTTQEIDKVIDVFIGDRVRSGAKLSEMLYEITVEGFCVTQYNGSTYGASKIILIWG